MLLSIIIINYQTSDVTSDCIKSIRSSVKSEDFEIIVVDNGSGDKDVHSLQKLRDKFGFKFLISAENLGFAGGCNLGAEMAGGRYLLFLNSDTKVEDDSAIKMIGQMTENIAVMGGKLKNSGGNVEKSAGKFYGLFQLFLMLIAGERLGLDRFAPTKFEKVDFVSGGFMLVSADKFRQVSGFDSDYFMYLEDMDLCLRLKNKGYDTYYYPEAYVIHAKHGSSNRSFAIYNIYRSMTIFYRKNKNVLEYNIARLLLFTKAVLILFLAKMTGKGQLSETYSKVLSLF